MGRLMTRAKLYLSADPKKAGLFCALLGVFTLMLGRNLLDLRPAGASASEEDQKSSSPIDRLVDPSALDELGFSGPIIRVPAPPPIERDAFRPDPRVFPDPSQADEAADEPPKSGPEQADIETRPQAPDPSAVERQVRRELESIRLKSVMTGKQAIAILEDLTSSPPKPVVSRVGDVVRGFEVLEIERGRVVLSKQGVRVVLAR